MMAISKTGQILFALQSIEVTAMQLSTTAASWEEFTLERAMQLVGGLDVIERQVLLIQSHVDAARANSVAVGSC